MENTKTISVVVESDLNGKGVPKVGDKLLGGKVKSVAIYDAVEVSRIAEGAIKKVLSGECPIESLGVIASQIDAHILDCTKLFVEKG